MASPFQQYQGGIEASTGNLVPAYGQMAAQTANAMAGFGQSIAEGLKQYNENTAKSEILTAEAETLGQQIQMFKNQFGDSPEHAQFAQSLQPYIEQLAKVPSMSLTQKMGAVTGVKAGFANIGQQLQVFELMRGERMKRDMNAARGGVKEFDEVTLPTAIVQSGKLPYYYDKTYTQNESEVVRLANEAKANGANVDISKVLSDWRANFKASAMSRTDLPPEVKEALVKQIEAGQNLVDNIQTDEESGATDYAKEAEMYERTATSVKEQLAPPKVEAPATAEDSKNQTRAIIQDTIAKLQGMGNKTEKISDAEFNKLVEKDPNASRYTKVANLEKQGWQKSVDENGKVSWSRETKDKNISDALEIYKGELAKLPKEKQRSEDPATVVSNARKELDEVNAQITALNKQIEEGDDPATSRIGKGTQGFMKYMGKAAISLTESMIKDAVINSDVSLDSPDAVRQAVNGYSQSTFGALKALGSGALNAGVVGGYRQAFGRTPTKSQERLIEAEISKALQKDPEALAKFTNDTEFQSDALNARKAELESRINTGKVNAQPSDIANTQQTQTPVEEKPEPSYALTNQRNMALGTTTTQIASSVESKRNDMKAFFTQKYGYVPASFEESFKAIYPEANFKTMETPYGAFMHDGKEWKQIQMQQPKVMSNKEMAEEKSVTFGQANAQGGLEFQELVPRSGVYVRGIFAGTPTEAFKFRTEMLETANARVAVERLIEINNMVGESMPWNAKLWGEAKALLPQIKAGLRTDIIGVGTVSNYEQQLIEEVVADPTKFWSLESSDRAKLSEIMRRVNNRLTDKPALYGLEVKTRGQSNAEIEKNLRLGRAGKSKLELDFESRGGKKGVKLDWKLSNKIPDALK
jgi:hypothetical protein